MGLAEDLLAVAAAHSLGVVRTDRWPMIAAYLLAAGAEGQTLAELAGLPATASGWTVDQLVPIAMQEADLPWLTRDEASELFARLTVQVRRGPGHPALRYLAALAPDLDYPGGRIGDAYQLQEWLDCDCHPDGQRDADAFEAKLLQLAPLNVETALADALIG